MSDRIDFISAYCDRWCERCAFTERCSSFAVQAALAMCDGNFQEALELAVGAPQPVEGEPAQSPAEGMMEAIEEAVSDSDLEEVSRQLEQRDRRLGTCPIAAAAMDYAVGTTRWLDANRPAADSSDPAMREATTIIGWDSFLVAAKLRRALEGHDEYLHGQAYELDSIQNDWNGSAKVALISIDRSLDAWTVVQDTLADEGSAALRAALQVLSASVRAEFPDAMRFRRPGFDA